MRGAAIQDLLVVAAATAAEGACDSIINLFGQTFGCRKVAKGGLRTYE